MSKRVQSLGEPFQPQQLVLLGTSFRDGQRGVVNRRPDITKESRKELEDMAARWEALNIFYNLEIKEVNRW